MSSPDATAVQTPPTDEPAEPSSAEEDRSHVPEELASASESERPNTWWSRPGGGAEVTRVAAPLVVSSLSWTVMTFVDRLLLKQESGAAMTAAFLSSAVWFALVCFPLGVCAYASTFVAQYHGSGQPKRIGPAVWQAVWTAVIISPVLLLAIPAAPWLFMWGGHDAVTTDLEIRYFAVLCWGVPGMLIGQAFSCFYSGRGLTKVVMIVDALYALLNVVLDYLWIFGHLGFPAMGIEGAAWATVVAMSLKALTYAALFLKPNNRSFATMSARFDRALFGRMLHFGWPSGLQTLVDVAGFTLFIFLVGRLGATESEATSMVFSISSLAFMPVFGIGMAASILVGQHLGEDRDQVAAQATWTSMHVALFYMAVVSAIFVFAPWIVLTGFFAGPGEAQDETVRALAVVLLRFVAAYNFLDAALMIFVNAIKGAGDTRFVLWVSLIMATLLAVASWLAVEVLNLGLYGCWTLITLWVSSMGVIYMLRFMQGKWRSMRVIEPAAA